jgi:hypothetical protein
VSYQKWSGAAGFFVAHHGDDILGLAGWKGANPRPVYVDPHHIRGSPED